MVAHRGVLVRNNCPKVAGSNPASAFIVHKKIINRKGEVYMSINYSQIVYFNGTEYAILDVAESLVLGGTPQEFDDYLEDLKTEYKCETIYPVTNYRSALFLVDDLNRDLDVGNIIMKRCERCGKWFITPRSMYRNKLKLPKRCNSCLDAIRKSKAKK